MSDMIRIGCAWLEEQRAQHLTENVKYSRNGVEQTVAATVVATEYDVFDGEGFRTTFNSRDFIINVKVLGLGVVEYQPEVGDEIIETTGNITKSFMVCSPDGRSHYEYADVDRLAFRIHTKAVDQSPNVGPNVGN
tara:strand:- start:235 stop:639 length:405 start_codon:yes stop_codon:yes gene_type:complete